LNIFDCNFEPRGLVSDDDHSSPRDEKCDEISLPDKKSSGAIAVAKSAANTDDALEEDFANCILKCKSVFKCKLCPRIICLNEEMVKVHLKSKVITFVEF
jgi:hypothetical protein